MTASSTSLAVIDIGSNSGRMIVRRADSGGHLEISGDARFPLRLVRESAARGRLGEAAATRVVEALRAFLALARGAGTDQVVAVATAAVREASDRDEWVRRIATETGVELEVLDGDSEARSLSAAPSMGCRWRPGWWWTSAAAAWRSAASATGARSGSGPFRSEPCASATASWPRILPDPPS